MNLHGFGDSIRVRAVRAWLASLPRPLPTHIVEYQAHIFGTRKLGLPASLGRQGTDTESNPFAGREGAPILELLADSLPDEYRAAIRRQAYVRQLCIDCALGRETKFSRQFAEDLANAIRERQGPETE